MIWILFIAMGTLGYLPSLDLHHLREIAIYGDTFKSEDDCLKKLAEIKEHGVPIAFCAQEKVEKEKSYFLVIKWNARGVHGVAFDDYYKTMDSCNSAGKGHLYKNIISYTCTEVWK